MSDSHGYLPLRVERLDYASKPYRIVTQKGIELYQWVAYPGRPAEGVFIGWEYPPIQIPVAFNSRAEADEELRQVMALAEAKRDVG